MKNFHYLDADNIAGIELTDVLNKYLRTPNNLSLEERITAIDELQAVCAKSRAFFLAYVFKIATEYKNSIVTCGISDNFFNRNFLRRDVVNNERLLLVSTGFSLIDVMLLGDAVWTLLFSKEPADINIVAPHGDIDDVWKKIINFIDVQFPTLDNFSKQVTRHEYLPYKEVIFGKNKLRIFNEFMLPEDLDQVTHLYLINALKFHSHFRHTSANIYLGISSDLVSTETMEKTFDQIVDTLNPKIKIDFHREV